MTTLEGLERGERVRIGALGVEIRIVDILGAFYDGTGVVGVTDRDRRYLVARDETGAIRVSKWTGITYREVLREGTLERREGRVVIPAADSQRVLPDQPLPGGQLGVSARGEP